LDGGPTGENKSTEALGATWLNSREQAVGDHEGAAMACVIQEIGFGLKISGRIILFTLKPLRRWESENFFPKPQH